MLVHNWIKRMSVIAIQREAGWTNQFAFNPVIDFKVQSDELPPPVEKKQPISITMITILIGILTEKSTQYSVHLSTHSLTQAEMDFLQVVNENILSYQNDSNKSNF